jgi:hypothetical protein
MTKFGIHDLNNIIILPYTSILPTSKKFQSEINVNFLFIPIGYGSPALPFASLRKVCRAESSLLSQTGMF